MIYIKESFVFNGKITSKKYPCQSYFEAEQLIKHLKNTKECGALFICSLINGVESYI